MCGLGGALDLIVLVIWEEGLEASPYIYLQLWFLLEHRALVREGQFLLLK